ncbi:hypothetical protein GCM10010191_36050 [Actinomadura vinacea]|uniref:MinD-like ATPase involved in chromosome partitioning or flagellar assembly n=1 Tax=Actinomadura vinacea TaxID=115336 RepID=A0ABN3J3I3_9ACTN
MDLPTYTNIWRIEKRLYKLYDLRLPMPLPLVQIGVFAGVFVPWIVLLRFIGIPFESPWHVLYIVPPGVLTWLATRPVIEGKRLTELLLSHTRYLSEPRTWCRLTPIREPREAVVVARVWRRPQAPAPVAAPERAPRKTRRKARKQQRHQVVEEAPATPVFAPTPATASAPQPLAEVAAQRDFGTLGTEDDIRVAGPSEQPPATRSDLHPARSEARPTEADPHLTRPDIRLARPAAHPSKAEPHPVETGGRPARPEPHPAKAEARPTEADPHPLETGRRPARLEQAESHAVETGGRPARPEPHPAKAEARPAMAGPHGAGSEARPAEGEPHPAAAGARPAKPWRRTSRDISHEEEAPRLADMERPPATPQLELGSSGKRALASGVRRPGSPPEFWEAAPQPPNTPQPEPTPDPASPARDAATPAPDQLAASAAGTNGNERATPAEAAPTAEHAVGDEAPSGDGAAMDESPSDAESDGADDPTLELELPPAEDQAHVTQPDIPLRQASPPTQPEIPQEAELTQPDIPLVPGAFGSAGQQEEEQEAPHREPPKPWSEELSNPQRAAATDARVWPPAPAPRSEEQQPAQPESAPDERPAAAGHPGRFPMSGPAPRPPAREEPQPTYEEPPAVYEEPPPAPSREVRSGPASPVRPRPLPPPPAAPPSEPAITPPGPEHEVSSGGLRRLIQAVGGGHGEADAEYQQRLQQPFQGTRHIVVLGCTGGAGQTVTALMLGHTFAQHNGEPVVAIDVNPGPGALARRTRSETNETLTGLITRADQVNSLTAMRRYTSQAKSGLDVIAAGKNPLQALDDRDYALAIRTIDRFYSVTLLDAAAAVVARVLPYADQIVLVAPASADAPRAVAMTFEWLDGHGYEELRSRAVTVINGVSRRSMDDVEQAEAVARGRCRALVRIPWDDHLSMDRAPRNELKSLRAPTRRAYLALAGVVAGGFTVVPERYHELQQEQEATR